MDIDTMEPGVDFVEYIKTAVGSCRVLIVVIGPDWVATADDSGRRRLDDPDDFVRVEVTAAFERGDVRVIPVLVGGAHTAEEGRPAAGPGPADPAPGARGHRRALGLRPRRPRKDHRRGSSPPPSRPPREVEGHARRSPPPPRRPGRGATRPGPGRGRGGDLGGGGGRCRSPRVRRRRRGHHIAVSGHSKGKPMRPGKGRMDDHRARRPRAISTVSSRRARLPAISSPPTLTYGLFASADEARKGFEEGLLIRGGRERGRVVF